LGANVPVLLPRAIGNAHRMRKASARRARQRAVGYPRAGETVFAPMVLFIEARTTVACSKGPLTAPSLHIQQQLRA